VLLSDHGEGLADHGEQEHGLFLYDEIIRVPLIIKQESNVGAGRRIADLVQHVDMVPTILDLVKAPIPDNLHGRSLKPLLEDTGSLREQPVYAEALYAHYHFGWSPLTTLTDGRHQYISAPRAELYDLTRDPEQRENLAADAVESGSGATELAKTRNALASALERLTASGRRLEPRKDTTATATAPSSTTSEFEASDPKDKVESLERYRAALVLLAEQKWPEAMAQFQRVLRDEPGALEVWNDLAGAALLLNRYDVALDAYRHIIELEPGQPDGYLGAADILLKERRFDEARARAAEAVAVLADGDSRSRALAHELLARIALARHLLEEAREEAALAQQADPGLPMSDFVEARILYDQGLLEDALPVFQKALAAAAKPGASQIFELHFYAAETLARLDRPTDAEAEYRNALRRFPQNVRARAALATLYHSTGQSQAVETAIAEMLRAVPTAESYALAARLWTSFGNSQKAQSVRAEARRAFTDARARATTTR
jgi:tetratricopeptide (TPR) repeat protein